MDQSLRDVCRKLHRAGLGTLPSCEGHFHDDAYFRHLWEHLQREQDEIRSRGLVVADSETNQPFVFRNHDYRLPWASFPAFLSEISQTQSGGYLGVELHPIHRHVARELNRHPYAEAQAVVSLSLRRPGSWIAAAYVDAVSPEQVGRLWDDVSKYLLRIVRAPARHLAIDIAGAPIYRPD